MGVYDAAAVAAAVHRLLILITPVQRVMVRFAIAPTK